MTSLNKICLHWTAGSNYPCDKDLDSYHFCVDKNGKKYNIAMDFISPIEE